MTAREEPPRLATGEIDSAKFSGVTCYWGYDDGTTPAWCARCWSLIPAGSKGYVYGYWAGARCAACRREDLEREQRSTPP